MPRKKRPPSGPGPGQLSFFEEGALPKEPAKPPAQPPRHEPEALLDPEPLDPTGVEPRFSSPAQRETTAFEVYQASVRDTRNMVLIAVALASLLHLLRSGSTEVGKLSYLGLELSVSDRSTLIGLLGLGTLLASAAAAWSAFTTRALWRKCGLFYQEIVSPSDNRLVQSVRWATIYTGVVLMSAIVVHSLYFAFPHIIYFAVGFFDPTVLIPDNWDPEVRRFR